MCGGRQATSAHRREGDAAVPRRSRRHPARRTAGLAARLLLSVRGAGWRAARPVFAGPTVGRPARTHEDPRRGHSRRSRVEAQAASRRARQGSQAVHEEVGETQGVGTDRHLGGLLHPGRFVPRFSRCAGVGAPEAGEGSPEPCPVPAGGSRQARVGLPNRGRHEGGGRGRVGGTPARRRRSGLADGTGALARRLMGRAFQR